MAEALTRARAISNTGKKYSGTAPDQFTALQPLTVQCALTVMLGVP